MEPITLGSVILAFIDSFVANLVLQNDNLAAASPDEGHVGQIQGIPHEIPRGIQINLYTVGISFSGYFLQYIAFLRFARISSATYVTNCSTGIIVVFVYVELRNIYYINLS